MLIDALRWLWLAASLLMMFDSLFCFAQEWPACINLQSKDRWFHASAC